MTVEQYLAYVGVHAGNLYGQQFRRQFRDTRGTSELGALVCPSGEEFEQLKRAVAIMTRAEKENAHQLSDEQVHSIAADAKAEPGLVAIFLNGYALARKKPGK